MRTRAAIYARISRDPEDQRQGVKRQIEDARAHIAERDGWDVVAVLEDNDASGYRKDERRPGFAELKQRIRAGEIDAVVVQHQDRLARNLALFSDFAEICRVNDIRIEVTTGAPVDLLTASGRFQTQVQAVVDEHYSGLLAEKVQAAVDRRAKAGLPTGGGAGGRPFGYERDQMTVVDREASAIRHMADQVLVGQSLRSLATWVNAEGLKTTAGNTWTNRRVRDTLLNPRYAGLRVHQGAVIGEAAWPAILEREVWERVSAFLRARTRQPVVRSYLLAGGLLRCGKCGASMKSGRARGRRRYVCPPSDLGGCNRSVIDGDGVEGTVGEAVMEALTGPEFGGMANEVHGAEAAKMASDLRGAEAQLDGLAAMWAQGDITRSEYLTARPIIRERVELLRKELAADAGSVDVMSTLPSGSEALRTAWDAGDLDWRRAVVSSVVESVTVGDAVHGRNFYDPTRITITWHA